MKEYYYADPTGNITILAPLPEREVSLPELAAGLMAAEPFAEQVGFLSGGGDGWDITLTMAGGEFCGNAALSAAAVCALRREPSAGAAQEPSDLFVRVSGVRDPVPVRLVRTGAETFTGRVQLPAPLEIRTCVLEWEGASFTFPLVRFPGITHLIAETAADRAVLESAIGKWCGDLDSDALGVMQLDMDARTLTPLVYVRSGGTLFWEHSCASGTAAAGAVLCARSGPGEWGFREPAGTLKIRAEADGRLLLTGNVRIWKRTISM